MLQKVLLFQQSRTVPVASNSSFNSNIQLSDGTPTNAIFIGVSRSTTPTFPLKVNVKGKNNSRILLKGLMRATSDEKFSGIPLIYV
jgi:hypothetical protein